MNADERREGGEGRGTAVSFSGSSRRSVFSARLCGLLCGLFLLFYVAWAGSSIPVLSPTIDEPLHSVGAWHARFASDFRVDREDPALWLRWLSLFQGRGDVRVTFDQGGWEESRNATQHPLGYFARVLGADAGNPFAVIRHARWASLMLAAGLGVSLAYMAGRLGGAVAGVAAAGAFALEPLFLGHGAIVKNDVAITLCFVWAVWFARGVMRGEGRARAWAGAGLVMTLALLPLIKFSGPAMAGIAVVPLVMSAWTGWGWTGVEVRGRRMWRVGVLCVAAVAVFVVATWATYDFRFLPSRDGAGYDWDAQLLLVAKSDLRAQGLIAPNQPSIPRAVLEAWSAPWTVRAAKWANDRKLLPQSYLVGLTYTYGSTLSRRGYLFGEQNVTGWWYYFPVAWGVKSPVTWVVVAGLTGWAGLCRGRWRRWAWWWVPGGVFVVSAMAGHLNIGLRHLMPAYPFVIVGVGVWVGRTWGSGAWMGWRRWAWGAALVALVVEVVPERLAYVQFFNVPARAYGSLELLGDSNLDWGQDLWRLAAWEREHPGTVVYAYLFTAVTDPKLVGLTLRGRSEAGGPGGVYAISATRLQGIYDDAAGKGRMAAWRKREVVEVLGGTIFLYRTDGVPGL